MHTDRTDALKRAIDARADWLDSLDTDATDCFRLLHGAVEGAPGTAVDRYGPILLLQTWREPLAASELDAMATIVDAVFPGLVPVWNNRKSGRRSGVKREFAEDHDPELPDACIGHELGLRYDVTPRHRGRDPLLFLDFRSGRRHVLDHAEGRSVLNLFAYTCGMGVVSAKAGASEVLNVDFASSALDTGATNAALNDLSMGLLHADCLPVIRQMGGLPPGGRRGRRPKYAKVEAREWDLVILDPPRWARSAFGAVDVVRDYPTLFKPTVLATRSGGNILATNNVASVGWDEWVDVLERCASKAGRPIASLERIAVDPDFPTPDGQSPLKMAWITMS